MTNTIIITLLLIGFAAGVLSGLVGVGGGIIIVPALVFFMQYTQAQAQGTSLGVLTLPVVAFAFYVYYAQLKGTASPIDFKVIGLIAIGFVAGGLLGSNVAIKLDQAMLRKVFAAILIITALKMLEVDTYISKLWK
jgi:uncharacterized protein